MVMCTYLEGVCMFGYGLGYGYGFGIDPVYFGIIVISLILGALSQWYIKKTYATWSHVSTSTGKTGAEIARDMLNLHDCASVRIGHVAGSLTDYFDPRTNSLHLSPDNYTQSSVASVAVACHEAGHAIQTAQGLVFSRIRQALVPAVNFAQNAWSMVLFMGVVVNAMSFVKLGVALFAIVVLFQIITLPVEIDASRRAVKFLSSHGAIIDKQGARQVLIAAALTYVSGALVSILQLVYLLSRTRQND